MADLSKHLGGIHAARPKGNADSLPARYSKLGARRRREIRELYERLQGDLCYYCKQPLAGEPRADIAKLPVEMRRFPPGFLENRVHLHHDHKTDLTLGAVHAYCNAVLWQYHGE